LEKLAGYYNSMGFGSKTIFKERKLNNVRSENN
jgi:hypothetical protein